MPLPNTPQSGDPPVIAILRKHARSGVMKTLLILLGAIAVLQTALIASGRMGIFTLNINGRPSRVGSLLITLALVALVFLSFWKLYRAAGKEPGSRLPTMPATVGKVFTVIALIFACFLAIGALTPALALLIPGSALPDEITKQMHELIPELEMDVSTMLIIGFTILSILSVLELVTTFSLLRTVKAAKHMLKTGVMTRGLSRLSAVTLLINAGLLALFCLLSLFSEGGFWGILNNLPLAGELVCFALLILRARADLDSAFAPSADPAPNAGPELN